MNDQNEEAQGTVTRAPTTGLAAGEGSGNDAQPNQDEAPHNQENPHTAPAPVMQTSEPDPEPCAAESPVASDFQGAKLWISKNVPAGRNHDKALQSIDHAWAHAQAGMDEYKDG